MNSHIYSFDIALSFFYTSNYYLFFKNKLIRGHFESAFCWKLIAMTARKSAILVQNFSKIRTSFFTVTTPVSKLPIKLKRLGGNIFYFFLRRSGSLRIHPASKKNLYSKGRRSVPLRRYWSIRRECLTMIDIA
jgi:hypothetical protein